MGDTWVRGKGLEGPLGCRVPCGRRGPILSPIRAWRVRARERGPTRARPLPPQARGTGALRRSAASMHQGEMLDRRRGGEERPDDRAPFGKERPAAELLRVVLERLPLDHEHVAIG